MNNILVLLTMKHSYKAVLDLVSLGYKVSIITLDPKHTQVKKISGYIDLRYQTKSIFENIFFENDFRLKSVSNKLKNYLDEKKPKLAFCLSWHWLIDRKFLNKFRDGVFGWHGSMFRLPNGLGRSPMNWSIRLGGKQIFHTCFKYTNQVDRGPIFFEKKIKIEPFDHIDDLLKKSTNIIVKEIKYIKKKDKISNLKFKHVVVKNPLKFERLNDESGEILFDGKNLTEMSDLIRSCSDPFPCAFIKIKNKKKIRISRVIKKKVKGCLIIKKGKEEIYCLLKKKVKYNSSDLIIFNKEYKIMQNEK